MKFKVGDKVKHTLFKIHAFGTIVSIDETWPPFYYKIKWSNDLIGTNCTYTDAGLIALKDPNDIMKDIV